MQQGDQFVGAHMEIMRELARRTGHPLRIEPCPLKRCLYMLEHGQADIAIGLQDTPERARFLRFLRTPYREHSSDKVFYVAKNSGVRINSFADLAPLHIGIKLGADYFKRFDNDTSLHKETVPDMALNFQKLSAGRIDTLLIPEDQGAAYLARLKLGDKLEKAAFSVTDGGPRAVAVSRSAPHIHERELQIVEQAMADMVRDGTVARLVRVQYYDAFHIPYDALQIK
jgi:polar amino acid transport system substrate-binding protein